MCLPEKVLGVWILMENPEHDAGNSTKTGQNVCARGPTPEVQSQEDNSENATPQDGHSSGGYQCYQINQSHQGFIDPNWLHHGLRPFLFILILIIHTYSIRTQIVFAYILSHARNVNCRKKSPHPSKMLSEKPHTDSALFPQC